MPDDIELNFATEDLSDAAFASLEDGDYLRALRLSRELKRRRFSAWFEIAGRSFYELGKLQKAIRTFQQGVEIAPTVGVLWHWLGTCQSDMGMLDQAEQSFRRSLDIGDLPRSGELYNLAVLEERRGRFDKAIQFLDQISAEDDLGPSVAAQLELRARLYLQACRLNEAEDFIQQAVQALEDEPEINLRLEAWQAELALMRGFARQARMLARRVIRQDNSMESVMTILRRARNLCSDKSLLWRIMLEGMRQVEDEVLGFFVNYEVIAETVDQAARYASQVERLTGSRGIQLAESSQVRADPNEPQGVVRRVGGYCFFSDNQDTP